MITQWYSLPLHIAQHHVTDVDVRFDLTHKRGRGWYPLHCLIAGDGDELVALSFGAAEIGTFARVVTDAAMRHWATHSEAILDDAGLLEPEPHETPEYSDAAYIPTGHGLRGA